MENTNKVFNCNMELTLDIIGGKWKPILLYHIGNQEVVRYGQLRRLVPTISERVLSRELRALELTNLIVREAFDEKVLRVEYSLTDSGKEVLPLLNSLTEWGNKYNKQFQYAKILCE
ncbi:MAG: helix-turn-helix domain-containing protein [Bacillota bacterium]